MRFHLLLLAPLLLLGCGGDNSNSPSTPPDADVLIVSGAESKGANAFDPSPFTVSLAAGGVVKWGNNDGETHTVTADNASFNSGNLGSGNTFSHTFVAVGTVNYHCSIHPSMVGTITVQP
jgi:plastocyanin